MSPVYAFQEGVGRTSRIMLYQGIGEDREEGTELCFKNHNRKMRVPFVVYADFECITEPILEVGPKENKSTDKYQQHKPSGFTYLIKCFNDRVYYPKLERRVITSSNDDIAQQFIDSLENDVRDMNKKTPANKKYPNKTPWDFLDFEKATTCHICGDLLGDDKVWGHCHFTSEYRGAAHNSYNLNFKVPKFIPIIFHNLSGYDSHLFITNLSKSPGEIKCIPQTEEKYISFSKTIVVGTFQDKEGKTREVKRELHFIGSYKFTLSSLNDLVKNMPRSSFKVMKQYCDELHYTPEQFELLLRKGVFPYDLFDSFSKLKERKLPPKEAFFSMLHNKGLSDDDYAHAQ